MQSRNKLHQQVDDLLGPPGPDADPLELGLRSLVQAARPMVEGLLSQYDDAGFDVLLEHAALFFLGLRSDGAALDEHFLAALAQVQAEAAAAAQTVEGTATEQPQAGPPVAPQIPTVAADPATGQPMVPPSPGPEPAAQPAPAAPASPDAPAPAAPSVPAQPPADPTQPSSPASPSSSEPSAADSPGTTPAPRVSNPVPPWGG